jgi:hypothetical protein
VAVDVLATVVASLIGAVLGSLGAQWLRNRFQAQSELTRTRRDVAQRHLIQLQDAMESLYFRLANLAINADRNLLRYPYYALSSIYALANFLAHKRRLMLDGAYALLDVHGKQFPHELETALERVEALIGKEWIPGDSFFRYQRQALGESLLIWSDGWRVANYAEFVEREARGELENTLKAAKEFFGWHEIVDWAAIRDALGTGLALVAERTGVGSPTESVIR